VWWLATARVRHATTFSDHGATRAPAPGAPPGVD
jgi:hypothetical protein